MLPRNTPAMSIVSRKKSSAKGASPPGFGVNPVFVKAIAA